MPSSIIFFINDALAYDSVKLGQFVLDVDDPTEGYYPMAIVENDVEAVEPRVYHIIESCLAAGANLDIEFIKSFESYLKISR